MRAGTFAAIAAPFIGATLASGGPARAEYRLDTVNTIGCAQEGGVCRMPYPTNVYFGVPGRTNGRPFPQGGAVPCNVQSFGDPAPGQRKSCWYAPRLVDQRGDERMRGDYRDRRDEDRYDDRSRRSYDDYGYDRRRYRRDPDDY